MLIDLTDTENLVCTIDLSKLLYVTQFDHKRWGSLSARPINLTQESMVVLQSIAQNPNILNGRSILNFMGGSVLLVKEEQSLIKNRWLEMMTAGTDLLSGALKRNK